MTLRSGAPRTLMAAALAAAAVVLGQSAEGAKKKRKPPAKPAAKPTPTAVPRPHDPTRVTFMSSDGVLLAASWRPVPGNDAAPAVLLLHAFSRDRRTWDELAPALTQRGLATLALDLRGHGESTRKTSGSTVRPSPGLLASPYGFPSDIDAACRWLKARAPKVGVMGLSVGGNLAVLATASRWADVGVAVSTSTEKLAALAGTRPTKPRGLLVLAAENDPGRAASARMLHEAGEMPKAVRYYPGAGHNLGLFTERPEAWEEALGWLSGLLGTRGLGSSSPQSQSGGPSEPPEPPGQSGGPSEPPEPPGQSGGPSEPPGAAQSGRQAP